MAMRYGLVLIIALVVLSGCTGGGPGASPASTPTDRQPTATATATATTTATTTPYPNSTAAFPDGPKSRPALPGEITAETAGEYAITHEYRYSYNRLWDGPETEVGMSEASCGVQSTTREASGYLVTVRCTAYVNEPAPGNTTRTQHADLPPWTVRYYLDENSVVREEVE
ncbi:hypothetical protein [Salinigranum salinum]|uniref:hypothetical protein n=1 Tax=Salinigranum salinum TaxID=1364937 RepID=UPI001864B42A|nr:hypothetical protein [Salinigranum salinum]